MAWDPKLYQDAHSYVWQLGESLLEWLQPRAGERILDIGCGTGQLTSKIASAGAQVVGLDKSPDMLDQARRNYPELTFVEGDAQSFRFDEPFDAVFSNAVLHWVKDQHTAAGSIARALRRGGRFVCEFGGKGNTAAIVAAFEDVLGGEAAKRCPWFYPSIGEFATLLECHGLEVRQASLFDRPTPLQGENALEEWLRMFCGAYFQGLSAAGISDKIRELVACLSPTLYRGGVWTIDHRRLRVLAVKTR